MLQIDIIQMKAWIFLLVGLVAFVLDVSGNEVIPYAGEGPSSSNVFYYETVQYFSDCVSVGQDAELQLTCVFTSPGLLSQYVVMILSNLGQIIVEFPYISVLISGTTQPNVAYDSNLHFLIFVQKFTTSDMYFINYNVAQPSSGFNVSISGSTAELLAGAWIMDSNNGVFYTLDEHQTQISSWNTTTAAFITTYTSTYRLASDIRIANNSIIASSQSSIGNNTFQVTILTCVYLQPICSFSVPQTQYLYSYNDESNFYLVQDPITSTAYNLYAYDSLCSPSWRLPLVYGNCDSFTYDNNDNIFLFYDLGYFLHLNKYDPTSSQTFNLSCYFAWY